MVSPLRVGITGGIGSGKSALTDYLATQGATIVDADLVAREVVEPGSEALALISEHFGPDILLADGSLNRAALRRVVFHDPQERKWLEAVTHPRIGALIGEKLAAATSPYVVLSSPLLLEGSQKDFVDYVVVVDVPEETQVERTCQRDGNGEKLVRAIMDAQLPRDVRRGKADRIIDNSGSLDDLRVRAHVLHGELMGMVTKRRQHES